VDVSLSAAPPLARWPPGAGYEIQAKRQMDRLEEDLRNEKISRREYEARKRQIEAGSILY
jgi:hypothetical protein